MRAVSKKSTAAGSHRPDDSRGSFPVTLIALSGPGAWRLRLSNGVPVQRTNTACQVTHERASGSGNVSPRLHACRSKLSLPCHRTASPAVYMGSRVPTFIAIPTFMSHGRTSKPWLGAHWKYTTPFTLPLFFPTASSSSTPAITPVPTPIPRLRQEAREHTRPRMQHAPREYEVRPTNRTVPWWPPITTRSPLRGFRPSYAIPSRRSVCVQVGWRGPPLRFERRDRKKKQNQCPHASPSLTHAPRVPEPCVASSRHTAHVTARGCYRAQRGGRHLVLAVRCHHERPRPP